MVKVLSGDNLIDYTKITSLRLFYLKVSDFFVYTSIIRNKSPPLNNWNMSENIDNSMFL